MIREGLGKIEIKSSIGRWKEINIKETLPFPKRVLENEFNLLVILKDLPLVIPLCPMINYSESLILNYSNNRQ